MIGNKSESLDSIRGSLRTMAKMSMPVTSEMVRSSLEVLYALASTLNKRSMPYRTNSLYVGSDRSLSVDHLYFRLQNLIQPVLMRLTQRISNFEKIFNSQESSAHSSSVPKIHKVLAKNGNFPNPSDIGDTQDPSESLHKLKKHRPDMEHSSEVHLDLIEENEIRNKNVTSALGSKTFPTDRTESKNEDSLRTSDDNSVYDEDEDIEALRAMYGDALDETDTNIRFGELSVSDDAEASDIAEAIDYQEERLEANGKSLNANATLDSVSNTKTQYEKNLEEESAIIRRLEEERVLNTSWTMSGETGARKRPVDALLEETLDFEHAMKSVPVITTQQTTQLEERIQARIISGRFDNVTRRTHFSSAGDLLHVKRDAGVESEKSKMSLVDLYEKDYLDRVKAISEKELGASNEVHAEPLTEIEKDELRAIQLWKRLAHHLDALSNYFFTPKPVYEELEAHVRAVEHKSQAISMESIGHFALSPNEALAPQDLYRPRRDVLEGVGSNEMSPDERKALRRSKKANIKLRTQYASKHRESSKSNSLKK